jgi:renal tumor antigen
MDMSMYDFLRSHKRLLSENRVKNYLYQLVSGVNHLHRNDIIHRDIKPENILIKVRPVAAKNTQIFHTELVQIGDLGSVCRVDGKPPRSTYVSTRWYRAPECILTTGYYGAKMDIWALGCCFFEMLTLQPLFPGDNEMDQMQKIHKVLGSPSAMVLQRFKHRSLDCTFVRCEPKSFYQLLPFLSARGVDMMARTLSYLPDGRPTASKLLEHTYFEDQRRTKHPPLASKSTPRLEMRAQEKPRQRRTPSHDLRSSISLINTNRKMAADRDHQVNKQREKLWGMNECPSKTKMFEVIQRRR